MRDLYGIPIRESAFVPDFTMEYAPPRSRREARKRAVIAARRRRSGKPVPTYERRRDGYLLFLNGVFYGSPLTVRRLVDARAKEGA